MAAEGARRAADRPPPPMFDATPSRGFDDSIDGFRGAADEWPGDEGDFFYDVKAETTPNGREAAPGGGGAATGVGSREAVDGFARGEEEDEEEEEEEEAVNRRVRTFAGVVKESLARVGRAASAGDVDAEVAALINRLRRLAAER